MSNSTTKKSSPVTLPPQTSKSSFWQPPTNDVQPQSSRFQAEEDTAGWQAPPNMGIENNLITRSLQESIQPKCEDCAAEEKEPQIQTKLTVGAPGDPYEQEADRVAAQVMSMSDHSPQVQRFGETKTPIQMWSLAQSITPVVQRQVDEQVQMRQLVQRAFQGGGTPASGDLESRLSGSKGGGSTLAPEVRGFMESRFGADFSGVRVHTGGDAVQMNRELGAQAFTHGSDVYFGEGKSPGNNELTAHELTHVVQQTSTYINPSNSIQRDEAKPNQSVGLALLEKNRPAVETVRVNALARLVKIAKLQADGNRIIGLFKGRLLQVGDRYDQAYKRYADVIASARQEARDQQEMVDLVVGIAIGVAVGLCVEGVAAVAVVEAIGTVATKTLGKWGAKAAGEAVGEGAEAALGQGAKATLTDIPGKDLQPEGLKPEILRMEIWKSLTQLHEKMSKIGPLSFDQSLLMSTAEYAIGEIKSQKGGGSDMTLDEDIDLVLTVIKSDGSSQDLNKTLDKASQTMENLEKGISKMPDYNVDQMEKDIWILWMSTLKKDSNILDIDAIEDHLEKLGLVDFGWYTSDAEENEAIEKAKTQAEEIKKRRNAAVGSGSGGPKL